MRRKNSEIITRLVTIAMLSALGFVLMAFCRIPYPPSPWLMIEISDIVVLLAYVLYGFSGSILTAILKTALDMSINGLSGFAGIGNITALFTSLMYIVGLYLCSHIFRMFNKGLGHRIIGYVIITIYVTVILTTANCIFITPTYLCGYFTTCFDSVTVNNMLQSLEQMGYSNMGYAGIIFLIYFPFNLMKGAIIFLVYELLFNRIVFVLMKRSPFMKKYFLGSIFKKNDEESKINDENK